MTIKINNSKNGWTDDRKTDRQTGKQTSEKQIKI